jgi:hypothetical protein
MLFASCAERRAADPPETRSLGLQAIVEDRKGTRWCGFSGGLFRFDGKTFVHVGREALLR